MLLCYSSNTFLATHPLHSACHTEAAQPGRIAGISLGAWRREVRLEEGLQLRVVALLLAEMPPTTFCENRLTPSFSFSPCEEKTIKMTFQYWPSGAPFISTVRTLSDHHEQREEKWSRFPARQLRSHRKLAHRKIWLSRFLTTCWLFLPSSAAGGT